MAVNHVNGKVVTEDDQVSEQLMEKVHGEIAKHGEYIGSWFTICGDACLLSCVSDEACLAGWSTAGVCRGRAS